MNTTVSVSLKPVDRVEILTLIDNYVDLLLPPSEAVSRFGGRLPSPSCKRREDTERHPFGRTWSLPAHHRLFR
jgi:hypothetical protein